MFRSYRFLGRVTRCHQGAHGLSLEVQVADGLDDPVVELPLGVLALIGNGVRLDTAPDVQIRSVDNRGEQEGGDVEDDEP